MLRWHKPHHTHCHCKLGYSYKVKSWHYRLHFCSVTLTQMVGNCWACIRMRGRSHLKPLNHTVIKVKSYFANWKGLLLPVPIQLYSVAIGCATCITVAIGRVQLHGSLESNTQYIRHQLMIYSPAPEAANKHVVLNNAHRLCGFVYFLKLRKSCPRLMYIIMIMACRLCHVHNGVSRWWMVWTWISS